jgi:hypothetical protein
MRKMGFHKKDRHFLKTTGVVALNGLFIALLLFLVLWVTGTINIPS